jgi:hypothetical protein
MLMTCGPFHLAITRSPTENAAVQAAGRLRIRDGPRPGVGRTHLILGVRHLPLLGLREFFHRDPEFLCSHGFHATRRGRCAEAAEADVARDQLGMPKRGPAKPMKPWALEQRRVPLTITAGVGEEPMPQMSTASTPLQTARTPRSGRSRSTAGPRICRAWRSQVRVRRTSVRRAGCGRRTRRPGREHSPRSYGPVPLWGSRHADSIHKLLGPVCDETRR